MLVLIFCLRFVIRSSVIDSSILVSSFWFRHSSLRIVFLVLGIFWSFSSNSLGRPMDGNIDGSPPTPTHWNSPSGKWRLIRPTGFFSDLHRSGKWLHGGELWTDWTGGFLAGMMWQFHRRTGDADWRQRAEHYSKLLEHRQHDRNVHDLGFIFLSTYLPWYELTGDEHLHEVLIQAGRTLAMRVHGEGQYLCSFVGPESLFIDIMMNVPIIFYAANETGDEELRRIATAHCRTTRDTIVRADGSTAHEGIFDLRRANFCGRRRTGIAAATALGSRAGLVAVRLQQVLCADGQRRVSGSRRAKRGLLD